MFEIYDHTTGHLMHRSETLAKAKALAQSFREDSNETHHYYVEETKRVWTTQTLSAALAEPQSTLHSTIGDLDA